MSVPHPTLPSSLPRVLGEQVVLMAPIICQLLYTTTFKDCPIDDKARRGIHAEEIEASPEGGSDR